MKASANLHTCYLQLRLQLLQNDSTADTGHKGKRLRNQFNFSERGIQTTFYPPRERGTNTELPEMAEASGTCSQWDIYDAYDADLLQQRQQVSCYSQAILS